MLRTGDPILSAFVKILHPIQLSKVCLFFAGIQTKMFKLGRCTEENKWKLSGIENPQKLVEDFNLKDEIDSSKRIEL